MTELDKGQLAQLKIQLRANEFGFIVSIPTVPWRYDVIIDDDKKRHRVQAKYTSESRSYNTVNLDLRRKGNRTAKYGEPYSAKEIDALLVYIPFTDKLYWLGAEIFDGKKSLTLRYGPPKSRSRNQTGPTLDVEKFVW